jgi:serine/threonine protein kinase/Tol biopolymer transport system component
MSATLERGVLLHKRYRIVEILGQGGMGSVYRAVDENLGVDVAVKENLFTTDEYARQFRLEAVILANLRHPTLPRVTDHFVIAGQGQYLVMDFIEGEDLRQRMERTGTISEEEAVLIGLAMCDALQYLHTRKPAIIHRDVKPGNVRIAPDGHVHLVDFGLAKLVKGSQATTTGARAMTPGYSPPEQYGTARTDPRTDIYSLGATLYAGLTGVIPEDSLARAMDNVELTPLRKRNPRVSRKLASAIEKAMAVRPEDRFQTAEEFKQALMSTNVKTQHLEGEIQLEPPPQPTGSDENGKLAREIPPEKTPPPIPTAPSQPRRREGSGAGFWIFLILFTTVVLVAVGAVAMFWSPISHSLYQLLRSATPVPSPTQTSTIPATPHLQATATWTVTPTNGPTLTPSLTFTPSISLPPTVTFTPTETLTPTATVLGGGLGQIAFASSRAGAPQIFLINSDGSDAHQLTNLADGACQPDWSPDGLRLVFISPCLQRQDEHPGASMYIINLDGSGMVQLPASDQGDYDPAWSPDGKRIAFTSLMDGSPQVYVLNLDDNSVTRLTQASSNPGLPDQSRQPAWAPGGTQLAYTGRSRLANGSMQIWVMSDVGRGATRLVQSGPAYWDTLPVWSPDGNTLIFSEGGGDQALGWLMSFNHAQHLSTDASKLRDYATHADFSPDGLWITYESLDIQNPGRSDYDVYELALDGSKLRRLTNDLAQDFDAAWQPVPKP